MTDDDDHTGLHNIRRLFPPERRHLTKTPLPARDRRRHPRMDAETFLGLAAAHLREFTSQHRTERRDVQDWWGHFNTWRMRQTPAED